MSFKSVRLMRAIPLLSKNPTSSLLLPSRPISPKAQISLCRPTSTTSGPRRLSSRVSNTLLGTSLVTLLTFTYLYVTDTRASVHQWFVVPLVRYFKPDAEDAHHFGTKALKTLYFLGLNPRDRLSSSSDSDMHSELWGFRLDNPLGISAGLDKLAEIPDALFALGPSIVEVGGCTPLPQTGNPRPRVFRIPSQNGLINRYGLNSLGADDMAKRLQQRVRLFAYNNGFGVDEAAEQLVLDGEVGVPPGSLTKGKLLMVQVAKNKDTSGDDIDAVRADYVYCVEKLARYADIMVVNVSSPNTPGLRTLQNVEPLTRILDGVVGAAKGCARQQKPRVMVKVSPDEDSDEQIGGIVEAVWRSGVDGIIVGNTTNRRSDIVSASSPLSITERRTLQETGGYSGPQMFDRTLQLVKRYRQLLDQGPPSSIPQSSQDQKVLFATGGITNGRQARELLEAGASVVQIYTALVYGGSGTVTKLKKELQEDIKKQALNGQEHELAPKVASSAQ